MNGRNKYTIPLVLFALTIWFVMSLRYDLAFICFFLMFGWIFYLVFKKGTLEDDEDDENGTSWHDHDSQIKKPCQVYYGDELEFSEADLASILEKHFSYFRALPAPEKSRFLQRLAKFIQTKTFRIHDERGFREMPVLISASAIQLSFGLERFLLPGFEYIQVYPDAFFHQGSGFRLLEGNVSGRSINISWKHFLEGVQQPEDGQNLGLHEMAHAYYYQNFITRQNTDNGFVNTFPSFNNTANKIFELEKSPGNDLYSDYALTNFQEFWAESLEIFFEKPEILHATYPDLYAALGELLNQDPLHQRTQYKTGIGN